MRKYYCVVSSFYDDGMVISEIADEVETDKKPENAYKSCRRSDIYCDWFDSKEEATEFVANARLGLV